MKTSRYLSFVAIAVASGLMAMAQAPAPVAPEAAPAPKCCQPTPHPGGKGQGGMMGEMAKRLDLSDAQKSGVKAIFAKHKDSMESRGKAIREARHAFMEAERKPETSPEALKGLHRTLSDLEFDMKAEHKAMHQEITKTLTPDQQVKMARMEGFREGMRMAEGGRPGGPNEGGHRWGMKHGQGPGEDCYPGGKGPKPPVDSDSSPDQTPTPNNE